MNSTYLPEEHMVVLYNDENEIVDVLANYIKTNLLNNNRCIYITGDTDTQLLLENLIKSIDYNKYINSGQLLIINKEDSYSKEDTFIPDLMIKMLIDETTNAKKDGFGGLAITGEISWVLEFDDGFDKIMEYECRIS